MRSIYGFFDKLEDKIRGKLSHYPILYAFIGGIGIVVFWRGVWHTADFFTEVIFSYQVNGSVDLGALPWWDGPLSLIIGSILLLSTGLFVFGFIGNEMIVTGLKGEKKLTEKTEEEVRLETGTLKEIKNEVKEISKRLDEIEKDIEKN
ncbi:MAG: hypothetical protein NDI62_03010 [Burkholderiales bacterium]|nr:hypothetical protein [Burkholderiales bacterium]